MTSASEQMLGNKSLKRKLIKSVESVKNKVKALRSDRASLSSTLEATFQPITKPLNVLANNAIAEIKTELPDDVSLKNVLKKPDIKRERKSTQFETSFNKFSDAASADTEYNDDDDDYSSDDSNTTMKSAVSSGGEETAANSSILNDYLKYAYKEKKIPFGVNVKPEGLYIGDSPVSLSGSQLNVKDDVFPLTRGLMELIFRKEPTESLITTDDVDNYMKILTMTHAYRRHFKKGEQVQAHSNIKYRTFIKKYLLENKLMKGGCLNGGGGGGGCNKNTIKAKREITMKRFYPNTDYIYWDNPNELVDRLKLLIASQSAGNTNHTNEINSIIEELKEAGIIIE